MKDVIAVVMAGGKGERFWPLSRVDRPKPFLPIFGKETLIERTVKRLDGLVSPDRILVITSSHLVHLVHTILPEIPKENIIGEPVGRNTAPCIALAGRIVEKRWGRSAVLFVMGADYRIGREDVFLRAARVGARLASEEPCVVTLGIIPTYPATGFGYIEREPGARIVDNVHVHPVKAFREKPDEETANQFVSDGRHSWNSGMFLWNAGTVREKIRRHLPALSGALDRIEPALATSEQRDAIASIYPELQSISIDYGVMEKTDDVYVIPTDMDWDDVGAWSVLERMTRQTGGNTVFSGDQVGIDTQGCILYGTDTMFATIGVRDLVIVRAGDTILVMDKSRDQDIKKLLEILKEDEDLAKYL